MAIGRGCWGTRDWARDCTLVWPPHGADKRFAPGEQVALDQAMEPTISVAALEGNGAERFVLMIEDREVVRAVGPFTEDECREELGRRGVSPAAAVARIMRARRGTPLR